ncbi:hypothetical protein [Haloarcula salinisoli]|uniref:Uncharacterized protein n=1 Tax=Haloarcula salinisoli TaxID=2487746 RepID=A0A8J8C6K5_9EURY|nr:hypothetical protein [Halomicroarcula salinisoli]MBX0286116.1 hypothetical protein [Halomicroarcula salinisoli]MBX0302396.1 hypothetical protein [Halomicroarcula salinisoli]
MDRRKFLIGVGSVAAGGAVVSGTGAFTAARANRESTIGVTNDSDAFVALQVGDGLGADKRVHNDSGQLSIDFGKGAEGEGVNEEARYQVGAMDDGATGTVPEFESLYDSDTNPSAAGAGTPYVPEDQPGYNGDAVDQSAFVVKNLSGQDLDIQIGYSLDESASGAELYLQAHASELIENDTPRNDNSRTDDAVATTSVDFDENTGQVEKEQALSFQSGNVSGNEGIPPGAAIYVSLLVDTRGKQTHSDLDGDLVVSANKAAKPETGG